MKAMRRFSNALMLLIMSAGLLTAACGEDDPLASDGDDFEQWQAVETAGYQSDELFNLVEFVYDMLVDDSLKSDDPEIESFYDETNQVWEFRYERVQNGQTSKQVHRIQYLDPQGLPQRDFPGADSYTHSMEISFSFDEVYETYTVKHRSRDECEVQVNDILSGVAVMTGSGRIAMNGDFSGAGPDRSYNQRITWATRDQGLRFPQGECPVGSVRYRMEPYYRDYVFDGSANVSAVLRDGNGLVVGSSMQYTTPCAAN
jgi:hypothetical protein